MPTWHGHRESEDRQGDDHGEPPDLDDEHGGALTEHLLPSHRVCRGVPCQRGTSACALDTVRTRQGRAGFLVAAGRAFRRDGTGGTRWDRQRSLAVSSRWSAGVAAQLASSASLSALGEAGSAV